MGAREVRCNTAAALATVIGYEIRRAFATVSCIARGKARRLGLMP